MFILLTLRDLIEVDPAAFSASTTTTTTGSVGEGVVGDSSCSSLVRGGDRRKAPTFRDVVASTITDKYAFRVLLGHGLVICLQELLVVGEARLMPGRGSVFVGCSFALLVFRPHVGERLRARIAAQDENGLRLTMEFFGSIVVPPHLLLEGSVYDAELGKWKVETAGTSATATGGGGSGPSAVGVDGFVNVEEDDSASTAAAARGELVGSGGGVPRSPRMATRQAMPAPAGESVGMGVRAGSQGSQRSGGSSSSGPQFPHRASAVDDAAFLEDVAEEQKSEGVVVVLPATTTTRAAISTTTAAGPPPEENRRATASAGGVGASAATAVSEAEVGSLVYECGLEVVIAVHNVAFQEGDPALSQKSNYFAGSDSAGRGAVGSKRRGDDAVQPNSGSTAAAAALVIAAMGNMFVEASLIGGPALGPTAWYESNAADGV